MLIDISQPLDSATAVWPGDQPFELAWTLRRDRGDSVNVAAVRSSVHAGTHADGPLHVSSGLPVGALALEAFVGAALVVDARARVSGEPPAVEASVLAGLDPVETPRVLLRTRDTVDPTVFPDRFAALSPALARAVVERGFTLVGTDAPSIDPVDSTELPAHRSLSAGGVVHLENLVLDHVEPGRYTLIALPLRLIDADSSPVRAVLWTERHGRARPPADSGIVRPRSSGGSLQP